MFGVLELARPYFGTHAAYGKGGVVDVSVLVCEDIFDCEP
jgi:hypothetical protein